MSKRSKSKGLFSVIALVLVVIIAMGVVSLISKFGDGSDVSGGGTVSGSNFNIAYGEDPPQDTSKLWVKTEAKANKVQVENSFNRTSVGETLETLDIELDYMQVSTSAVVGTDLYLFLKDCSVVKVNMLTWQMETVATLSYEYTGAAVYADNIYLVISTYTGNSPSYYSYVYVHRFNILTNSVVERYSYTIFSKSATVYSSGAAKCVIIDDDIYIAGYCGKSSLKLGLIKFNVADRSFVELPYFANSLIPYLRFCSMVACGTDIYFFGGYYDSLNDSILKYDTLSDEFFTMESTLFYREYYVQACLVGNYIYLFGGRTNGSVVYRVIQKYDFEADTIEVLSDVLLCGGQYGAVCNFGSDIYVYFGSSAVEENKFQKLNLDFELDYGTLLLIGNGSENNQFSLYNSGGEDVKLSISCAYIGNAQSVAEPVECYLYSEELADWKLITV